MALEYPIYEAVVSYADPVKQVYEVTVTENSQVMPAIPLGVRRAVQGSVISPETYIEGDLVLIAKNGTEANAAYARAAAIILGLFPGGARTLQDVDQDQTKQGNAKDFYENTELYQARKDLYADTTFNDGNRVNVAGGDKYIAGSDTIIHMTDRETTIGSTDATLTTNSIDGSISTQSLVSEDKTPGVVESVRIINDTVLKTTKLYGNLNANKQPYESVIEHEGDLVYGSVRTALDVKGDPISQVQYGNDGAISLKSAKGIKLSRTTAINAYKDSYTQLLIRDQNIPEQLEENSKPYGRVAESEDWTAIGNSDDSGILPVYRPVPPGQTSNKLEAITDSTGTVTSKVTASEAFIDVRGDGSVVLRDAWGSEIRMVNGDIQLSAANKITTIAGTDLLSMCGGVAVTKADAGIQSVTNFGNIDMASGKEFNITANNNINVVGDADVSVLVAGRLTATAGKDLVTKSGGVVLVQSAGDFTVTATTINLSAEYDCTITNKTTLLRLTVSSIDIVSPSTYMHTDLEISDKAYDAGEFLGAKLSPTTGSGAVRIGNTVTVNGGLVVGDFIIAKSAVSASQFNALTVAPDTGVYKLRNIPRVSVDTSTHSSKSMQRKDVTIDAIQKLKELTAKSVLSNFFTAKFTDPKKESDDVVIYLPSYVYAGGSGGSVSVGSHEIASAGESVYIYPGQDFWQGDCVCVPDESGTVSEDSGAVGIAAIKTIAKESVYYGKSGK